VAKRAGADPASFAWDIEPFHKGHDRSAFACGQPALDDFLRAQVSQYEKRRLGKTYLAVPKGEKRVLGYYTLAAGSVAFDGLPSAMSRKLPKHPVPVVLLARLAVDRSAQGRGLGEGLLLDALARSFGLSHSLGVHAIEVQAIDDDAAAFYRKYGFVPLLDRPLHLYLPMASVEAVLEQ
jgi:GNAT superfamily N-acetyltransferase